MRLPVSYSSNGRRLVGDIQRIADLVSQPSCQGSEVRQPVGRALFRSGEFAAESNV